MAWANSVVDGRLGIHSGSGLRALVCLIRNQGLPPRRPVGEVGADGQVVGVLGPGHPLTDRRGQHRRLVPRRRIPGHSGPVSEIGAGGQRVGVLGPELTDVRTQSDYGAWWYELITRVQPARDELRANEPANDTPAKPTKSRFATAIRRTSAQVRTPAMGTRSRARFGSVYPTGCEGSIRRSLVDQ